MLVAEPALPKYNILPTCHPLRHMGVGQSAGLNRLEVGVQ